MESSIIYGSDRIMRTRMAESPQIRYRSGEVVRLGDRVRTPGGGVGVVKEIIPPHSEVGAQFGCTEGGVFLRCEVYGNQVIGVDDPDWEDVELLRRGEENFGWLGYKLFALLKRCWGSKRDGGG